MPPVSLRTPHKYRRFGKRQVLLILQPNDRLHSIHEILLSLLTSLFCFRLTLLAAKLLHSALRHELFTAILTLSNCFHFQHSFDGFTIIFFFPTVESTFMHHCRQLSTPSASWLSLNLSALFCHPLHPVVNWVRRMTIFRPRKFLAVEIRCKNILKFGYYQIPSIKC